MKKALKLKPLNYLLAAHIGIASLCGCISISDSDPNSLQSKQLKKYDYAQKKKNRLVKKMRKKKHGTNP